MNISCEEIVQKYLLRQNPLYAFNFPLSLLVAIVIFGVSKAFKWSSNSYVIQILIPILAFLLTMVLIDIVSKMMISKEKYNTCKLWSTDKKSKHNFEYYENNENNENNENQKNIDYKDTFTNNNDQNIVESPIEVMATLKPYPIEFNNDNSAKCIEKSNCCSLCSGTDNPCKIIAPIPGPQWLPQTAETVQNNLKNGIYTPPKC
jgi:hypothetical protein